MSVHRGHEAEYERRHTPIWPELEATLRDHGVRHYSIFLDPETNDLFGYVEIESEARWEAIASTDVCRRWWASMRELMPSEPAPDHRPLSRPLREVFHIGGDPARDRDSGRDRASETAGASADPVREDGALRS